MPTAKAKAAAKAAAKALAEKNSRRHERREACKSLNELARTLLVPAHNLVDAMNAAATDVEDEVLPAKVGGHRDLRLGLDERTG